MYLMILKNSWTSEPLNRHKTWSTSNKRWISFAC